MSKSIPADAPPAYDDAVGGGASSSQARNTSGTEKSGRLNPGSIPVEARRSMEDEQRPLPKGWVRSFDAQSHHQFFVDTTADPPRSIWVHPYDDPDYLNTLSKGDRERIEEESYQRGHRPSHADIVASHSDVSDNEELGHARQTGELPPRPDKGKGKSFGRKFKDKLTGTSHTEREAERQRRVIEESRAYEQHQKVREAMARAAKTGEPQLIGRDKDGKDVYVEPPPLQMGPQGFGYNSSDYGAATGDYGNRYNPYGPNGAYSNPNARYIRPSGPYGRPYGSGYGGGYGMPLMMGGGMGLMGGMMMADMMLL